MPENLENSAVASELQKVSFPIPKKGNAKACSNYRTVALISHTSKIMLKIQKTKITASGPISSWQIDGETVETVSDFI